MYVVREAKSKGWLDPNIFLWIAVSVADATAVNPNGIKILLANGFSTFLLKAIQVLVTLLKSLLKIHYNCPILWNFVFDNFILYNFILY